jgi:ectoine hydroxylase-related dioxygenase (phytanoyl-CoA dioxygenase family)
VVSPLPLWTKELALWHQDHFYVRGNTEIVTAWIPFQDTDYFNGCLSIMPGSHKLGVVPHDVRVGKKSVPSTIYDREIRLVEMRKGDVLLFNALLLHSGSLNVSSSIRYSLQPRYSPAGRPVDPGMGEVEVLR